MVYTRKSLGGALCMCIDIDRMGSIRIYKSDRVLLELWGLT